MDAMLLVKVTLMLSLALVAAHLARRAAAVTRHRLWTVAFASLVALPLLAFALPTLHVPVPEGWSTSGIDDSAPAALADNRLTTEKETIVGERSARNLQSRAEELEIEPIAARVGADLPVGLIFVIVWLAGTTAALAALLVSLLRARWLAVAASELDDPAWNGAAASITARLGMRRAPRLLVTRDVGSPMAGGVWNPVIYLPRAITAWSDERRDVVLAHEIAHLASGDPLRHVLARVAVALYWFH